MRIAAIDYGRARIGLAISDPLKIIASPLKVIKAGPNLAASAKACAQALSAYPDIEQAVLGLPLLLNGSEGEMANEVHQFLKTLAPLCPFPITLIDERLSSAYAEKMMRDVHMMNRKQRAQKSDVFAASLILEDYLMKLRKNT